MRTMMMNNANAIIKRLGSFAGASTINATVSPAAPRYAIPASALSWSFFVSEKNSNNPAASASTAIATNIQTVSGMYEGSTIDAIRIGKATAAVRIRVFILSLYGDTSGRASAFFVFSACSYVCDVGLIRVFRAFRGLAFINQLRNARNTRKRAPNKTGLKFRADFVAYGFGSNKP